MTQQTQEQGEVRLTEEQALTLVQRVGLNWDLVDDDVLWGRADCGKTRTTIIDIYIYEPQRKYCFFGDVENRVEINVPYENIDQAPKYLKEVVFNDLVCNPELKRLYEKVFGQIVSKRRDELEKNKRKKLDCLVEELKCQ